MTTEESTTAKTEISGWKWNHSIYTKSDWDGMPERSKVPTAPGLKYVVISDSQTDTCSDFRSCKKIVQDLQKSQMSRNYADIRYNFLVGSDGSIFIGRGWQIRSPIEGFANNKNIDVDFIGDYSVENVPTERQIDAVLGLIRFGVEQGMISEEYSLISANSTLDNDVLSPGRNIYRIMENWPHFDPDPIASATLKRNSKPKATKSD